MNFGKPSHYKKEELVLIGQLTRPHGVRGEIRCRPETDFPERFLDTEEIEVYFSGPARRLVVEQARFHKDAILLKLKGVDSLEQADTLRGAWVAVGPDEVVELQEGEHFHFELEGLQALDPEGQLLGRVVDVLANPAHEIYRIQGPAGEILIPAVPAYLVRVDLEKGHIVVRPPVYED